MTQEEEKESSLKRLAEEVAKLNVDGMKQAAFHIGWKCGMGIAAETKLEEVRETVEGALGEDKDKAAGLMVFIEDQMGWGWFDSAK